jgi:CBS domain
MDLAKKNEFFFPYNLDDPINTVFPDIFEHPFLFVYSDTKLIELTAYLGIGPQIYADGLLVFQQQQEEQQEGGEKISGEGIRSRKVIGRLSSKHIIRHLLQSNFSSYRTRFLHRTTASEIMDPITKNQKIKVNSPIRRVMDVFRETKFAFVPTMKIKPSNNSYSNDDGKMTGYFKLKEYVEDEEIAGVLSIRDFLPLFSRSASKSISNTSAATIIKTSKMISITTKDISSDLVSVDKNASIKDAIDIMINRQIRNIGIEDKDSNLIGMINDRTILEFLLRHVRTTDSNSIGADNNIQQTYYKGDITEGDSINSSKNTALNMSIINNLKIVPLSETRVVDDGITVSQASELLMSVHDPFLILKTGKAIVTPWDIVMKTTELFNNKQ